MTLTSWNSLDGNTTTQVRTCDVKWAYPQGSKWFIEWLDQRTGGIRQQEISESSYNAISSLITVTALEGFDAPSVGAIKVSTENIALATESTSPLGTIIKYDIGNFTYSIIVEQTIFELADEISNANSFSFVVSDAVISGSFKGNILCSSFKIKNTSYKESEAIGVAEIDSVQQGLIIRYS